jgi:hypothetical protein
MDDFRTDPKMDSPRPDRARLLESALVAQFIDELSGTYRLNRSTRFRHGGAPSRTQSGDDR